jgi:hypothetical protein
MPFKRKDDVDILNNCSNGKNKKRKNTMFKPLNVLIQDMYDEIKNYTANDGRVLSDLLVSLATIRYVYTLAKRVNQIRLLLNFNLKSKK